MISTFTAVFDASVLFGARLRSLLMELAMTGLFTARWSADVHREWMTAVSEARNIDIALLEPTKQCMDDAVPDGCVQGYERLIEGLSLPDPDDRHVLAAAIQCHASVIVTFNEVDFPAAALAPHGIDARHPDLFIRSVDEAVPGTLVEAARHDWAHYMNPPLALDQYIEDLRKAGVPKTAEYLTQARVLLEKS